MIVERCNELANPTQSWKSSSKWEQRASSRKAAGSKEYLSCSFGRVPRADIEIDLGTIYEDISPTTDSRLEFAPASLSAALWRSEWVRRISTTGTGHRRNDAVVRARSRIIHPAAGASISTSSLSQRIKVSRVDEPRVVCDEYGGVGRLSQLSEIRRRVYPDSEAALRKQPKPEWMTHGTSTQSTKTASSNTTDGSHCGGVRSRVEPRSRQPAAEEGGAVAALKRNSHGWKV